jgi:acylphosphatase
MQGILLSMIEMYAVVTGKVQGVRYRTYVQESATSLGLVGYVKNLSDGTVEVVAQGMPDTLKDFVEYLNEGSLLSKVEGVSVDWRSVRKTYLEFSMLY